jgi:membrane protease YdiL (CAAX protease family)
MADLRRLRWVILGASFEFGLAALAIVLASWLAVPLFDEFAWRPAGIARGISASVPLFIVFYFLVRRPIGPLGHIRRFFDEVLRPILGECSLAELALLSLAAGVGEETLFRGVLQEMLAGWMHPWLALALASLLFGLLHPISLTYVIIASLFGVYLGICWMASRDLLLVVTAHGLYDFLALAYLLRIYQPSQRDAH